MRIETDKSYYCSCEVPKLINISERALNLTMKVYIPDCEDRLVNAKRTLFSHTDLMRIKQYVCSKTIAERNAALAAFKAHRRKQVDVSWMNIEPDKKKVLNRRPCGMKIKD